MISIIPAIDLISGKCVRLTRGDYYTMKEYCSNPVDIAREFRDAGVKRLHVVDLDGAKRGYPVNLDALEKIAAATELEIDFGGGLRSVEHVSSVFSAGAHYVTAGSIAVKNEAEVLQWIDYFGQQKIILGADVRDNMIAIQGWQEDSDVELIPFLKKYIAKGIDTVISTDIERDGTMQGPSLDLYSSLRFNFRQLNIIASGGVKDISDIRNLELANVNGVIIGKALYEGTIKLDELKPWLC
jgi:phosphoribosylformimino-5-aminoimidazole carboxamide ribotide isomerase